MLCCMKKTLFLVLMLGAVPLSAAVYKWVDGGGQVHYSDLPSQGATEVELPESMVYTPPDYSAGEDGAAADSGEATSGGPYKSIAVVQPTNDETLRSNEGNVAVSIEISPGLAEGNKFRIYLDGNQVPDELSSPQITLQNLDRGTHSLEVAVVNGDGQELLRSAPVTFHLRRFTQLLPPRVKPEHPIELPPEGDDDDVADDDDDAADDDDDAADDDDDAAGDDDDAAGDDDDAAGDDDDDGVNLPTLPPRNPYSPDYRPSYNPRPFKPSYRP